VKIPTESSFLYKKLTCISSIFLRESIYLGDAAFHMQVEKGSNPLLLAKTKLTKKKKALLSLNNKIFI
jgi:hypothetical protein